MAVTCDGATNILSTSADLNGTLSGMNAGDQYWFRIGTVSGGPYTIDPVLQPSPSPAADGPVTQGTGVQLSPGTQYFYVIEIYDALDNLIDTSTECSFTTTVGITVECLEGGNCPTIGQTSAILCAVVQGNTDPNWHYEIDWGTTPGGPYPNNLVGAFADGTDPDGVQNYFAPGSFPSGTQIYYTWKVYDENDVLQATAPECTFGTNTVAVVDCDPATAVTDTTANLNGDFTDVFQDYRFAYGTTPGGPYTDFTPTQGGTGAGNQLVSTPIAGLTPNTQYYFVVQLMVGTNVETQSGECTFTTSAAPVVASIECEPADAITQTGANLNGSSTGAIPAGDYTYTLSYGTTPGGPYPNTLPPQANDGTDPDTFGQGVAGLTASTTYYYIWELRTSPGGVLVDTSGECSFTTLDVVPPASVNPQCLPATNVSSNSADISGTVDNMPPTQHARLEVGTAPGGPYTFLVTGTEPGDNTIGQVIGPIPVAGAIPGTTYYYRVAVYNDAGATIFAEASAECQFTIPVVSVDCAAATNITQTSFDANAVAHNVPTNWNIVLQRSSLPGGPYTTITAVPGDGTANQNVTVANGGLNAGVTYYTRWLVTDVFNQNAFTGAECPGVQTTPPPPNPTADCVPASGITSTSITFQGTAHNVPADHTIRICYGTAPGGPYGTCGPGFPGANVMNQPVAYNTGGLNEGTTYYYVVEVLDAGNAVVHTSEECNATTTDLPAGAVATPPTNVTPNGGDAGGDITNGPVGGTWEIIWGNGPGGPFVNVACAGSPITSNPQSVTCTIPAPPNTQVCYKIRVRRPDNSIETTSLNVQCFTTLAEPPPIVDPCEPATNVTPTSATLNATVSGATAGMSYRFRYSTTPGGPYTSTVPAGFATGASPEAYTANVGGLTPGTTYYYVAEVLNAAQQVVATGGECTFATTGSVGPGGFVYYCGQLYDSADCIPVDLSGNGFDPSGPTPGVSTEGDYWYCLDI